MKDSNSDIRRRFEQIKSRRTIRLVTTGRRTGLPRPVTVWFVYLDGRLFVRTSHRTNWYKNLRARSAVNAEVGGLKFLAEAEQVKDEGIIEKLRREYRRRYRISDIFSNLFMLRGDTVFFELKIITVT